MTNKPNKQEGEKPARIKFYPRSLSFERVDIFLRVKGRLPTKKEDVLTQEILDEYCERFEKGALVEGMVSLAYMYRLIKAGEIKPIVN